MLSYVQRASEEDKVTFRKLLFRVIVAKSLPLSVFDNCPEWLEVLGFCAPAFAEASINRPYISSHKVRSPRRPWCSWS